MSDGGGYYLFAAGRLYASEIRDKALHVCLRDPDNGVQPQCPGVRFRLDYEAIRFEDLFEHLMVMSAHDQMQLRHLLGELNIVCQVLMSERHKCRSCRPIAVVSLHIGHLCELNEPLT